MLSIKKEDFDKIIQCLSDENFQKSGIESYDDLYANYIDKLSYLSGLMRINYNELFKDKITFNSFQSVWQGRSWANVMPEVFTEENIFSASFDAVFPISRTYSKLPNPTVFPLDKRGPTSPSQPLKNAVTSPPAFEIASVINPDQSLEISVLSPAQVPWQP